MVEQVQVGAPIEHGKQWKVPEMVESALKYTAPSGRHSTEAAEETSSNDWKALFIPWEPSLSGKLELTWRLPSGIYH